MMRKAVHIDTIYVFDGTRIKSYNVRDAGNEYILGNTAIPKTETKLYLYVEGRYIPIKEIEVKDLDRLAFIPDFDRLKYFYLRKLDELRIKKPTFFEKYGMVMLFIVALIIMVSIVGYFVIQLNSVSLSLAKIAKILASKSVHIKAPPH